MNAKLVSFQMILRNPARQFLIVGMLTLLTGCATEPPPKMFYTAPLIESEELALVSGSRSTQLSTGNQITYLAAVDGIPIENARANFAYAIQVAPGYRALTVAYAHDSLLATTEITTELKAGNNYILKAEKAAVDDSLHNAQAETLHNVWIENTLNREIAGEKHLTKLNAIPDSISTSPENDFAGDFLLHLIGAVLDAMIDGALESDNNTVASSANVKGSQTKGDSESTPIKQPPVAPPAQNPKSEKTLPENAPSQGKFKKP